MPSLTQKMAGLPAWGWLLGAAAGAYLLLRRSKVGTATTTTARPAPAPTDYASGYQRGYTSGRGFQTVRARQQFSLDNLPGVGPSIHSFDAAASGIPIRGSASAQSPITGYIPWGSSFATLGPAQSGPAGYPGQSGQWAPVQGGFVNVDDFIRAEAAAVGGAALTALGGRGNSIGTRAADPHAYFHGSMKALPRYAHFTRSAGVGGAGHSEAVHATAHTAGLHPARLAMLNPRPHKFLRVA